MMNEPEMLFAPFSIMAGQMWIDGDRAKPTAYAVFRDNKRIGTAANVWNEAIPWVRPGYWVWTFIHGDRGASRCTALTLITLKTKIDVLYGRRKVSR